MNYAFCILARILFVLFGFYSAETLKIFGYISLFQSIGFMLAYNHRMTGLEVLSPSKVIWWNSHRPVHGILYFITFLLAINGKRYAPFVLVFDIFYSMFFREKHYKNT